ncbi:hypothetical protein OG462_06425 [Streptomyces sp. NBC_01077]|uniref:hypothetical protein n=1 Tax=Streptomyces sp. NBC_01077 TaxID=2903746 RepID=UPI0038677A13|nr:hypothetical protein OG462_06425 [Streptomyces sp. NBC_01077]
MPNWTAQPIRLRAPRVVIARHLAAWPSRRTRRAMKGRVAAGNTAEKGTSAKFKICEDVSGRGGGIC